MSAIAAETILSNADFRALRIQLVVHAVGGLLVLLAAATLSVYKPCGMTSYGRHKQHERPKLSQIDPPSHPDASVRPYEETSSIAPGWVYVVGIHAIGLVLLFVLFDLTGLGLRH